MKKLYTSATIFLDLFDKEVPYEKIINYHKQTSLKQNTPKKL